MQNTVCIITGAASGMGRQMAIQAAQRGSHVIATDFNTVGLAETKTMAQAQGSNIETHILDVSKAEAIVEFADKVMPTLANRKLFLINNAGVGLASGPFEATPLEDFEWLLSINLWGVVRMTKAFYPYFLAQNQGHIVNLSSVFGLAGIMHQSAYCTSKYGVRGFSDVLRMELYDTNIKVTCVHPGGIKTNIARDSRVSGSLMTKEMLDDSAKKFTANALTTPEEAARLILNAAEKGKARLLIGPDARPFEWLPRLMPTGYIKILRKGILEAFGNPFEKK